MTVDMLDTGTILVAMGEGDMRAYSLDFSDDPNGGGVTRGLTELLYRVGEMCGIEPCGKSWLVEALPSKNGWLLVISVHKVRRRKIYRVKREKLRPVCELYDADSLLDILGRNPQGLSGYSVYRYRDKYMLLPELYSSDAALRELGEYGRMLRLSRVAAARIQEFGEVLMQKRSRRQLTV